MKDYSMQPIVIIKPKPCKSIRERKNREASFPTILKFCMEEMDKSEVKNEITGGNYE